MATKLKKLSALGLPGITFIPVARYDKDHGGVYGDDRYIPALKHAGLFKGPMPAVTAGYANYGHSNNKGGEHLSGALDFDGIRYTPKQRQQFAAHLRSSGLFKKVIIEDDGHIHGQLLGDGITIPQAASTQSVPSVPIAPIDIPAAPPIQINQKIANASFTDLAGIDATGMGLPDGGPLAQDTSANDALASATAFIEKNKQFLDETGRKAFESAQSAGTQAQAPAPSIDPSSNTVDGLMGIINAPTPIDPMAGALNAGVMAGTQSVKADTPRGFLPELGAQVMEGLNTQANILQSNPGDAFQTGLDIMNPVGGMIRSTVGDSLNARGIDQLGPIQINGSTPQERAVAGGLLELGQNVLNAPSDLGLPGDPLVPVYNAIAPNVVSQQGRYNIVPSELEANQAQNPVFSEIGKNLPFVVPTTFGLDALGLGAKFAPGALGVAKTLGTEALVDAGAGFLTTAGDANARATGAALNAAPGALLGGAGYGLGRLIKGVAPEVPKVVDIGQATTAEQQALARDAIRRMGQQEPTPSEFVDSSVIDVVDSQGKPFLRPETVAAPEVIPEGYTPRVQRGPISILDEQGRPIQSQLMPTQYEAALNRMNPAQEAPPVQIYDGQSRVIDIEGLSQNAKQAQKAWEQPKLDQVDFNLSGGGVVEQPKVAAPRVIDYKDAARSLIQKGTPSGDALARDFFEEAGITVRSASTKEGRKNVINFGGKRLTFGVDETLGSFADRMRRSGVIDPEQAMALRLKRGDTFDRLKHYLGESEMPGTDLRFIDRQGDLEFSARAADEAEYQALLETKSSSYVDELNAAKTQDALDAAYEKIFTDSAMDGMPESFFRAVNDTYSINAGRLSRPGAVPFDPVVPVKVKPGEILDAQGRPMRAADPAPVVRPIDSSSPSPTANVIDIPPPRDAQVSGNVYTDAKGREVFTQGRAADEVRMMAEAIDNADKGSQLATLSETLDLIAFKKKHGIITPERATLETDVVRNYYDAAKQGKTFDATRTEIKEGRGARSVELGKSAVKTRDELAPFALSTRTIAPKTYVANLKKELGSHEAVVDLLREQAGRFGITASTSGRTPSAMALHIAEQISANPMAAKAYLTDSYLNVHNFKSGGVKSMFDAPRGYPLRTFESGNVGKSESIIPDQAAYQNSIRSQMQELEGVYKTMNLTPLEKKHFERVLTHPDITRADVRGLKKALSSPERLKDICNILGLG